MAKRLKVRIGDDSKEFGGNCAETLRSMGFFCITRPKDGAVMLDAIKDEVPDVAVVDLSMANFDAIELIKRINKSGVKKPLFIVTSVYDNAFAQKTLMQIGVSYFLLRPFDVKMLGSRINELMGYDILEDYSIGTPTHTGTAPDLEVVVTEMIHQLGVPAQVKGYHYIRSAILHCIADKEMLECVTKMLYPTVAKEFDTTPSRVERAIRHAIELAWDRGDLEILNSFFGYTVNTGKGKPTNSEFIALVTDKIKLKFKGAAIA
ncbi:MAG: sporulation transcription factor Spo0A [Oscillospiraceae bacterium]|nr:sporulation transcription factor Spo0A [Oscillospiraceae bacterium]